MFIKFKYDLYEVKLWAFTKFSNEFMVPNDFKMDFLQNFPKKKINIIDEFNLEKYLQEVTNILDKFMEDLYRSAYQDDDKNYQIKIDNFEKINQIERRKLIEWRSVPFERTKKIDRSGNSDLLG